MHFSKLLLTSLASLAVAQPAHHQHNKREPAQVVVTEHYTKVVTGGAPAPAPVQTSAPAPAQDNNNNVQQNAAAHPTSFSSKVASSSAAASSAPSSSGSSSGSGSSGSVKGGTGITYSPYSNDGGCKSADEVKKDISSLSSYSYIRIYGTDCNQVENVANAIGDDQQIFLGLFDIGNIENDLKTMKDGMKGNWDKVHTVSIGNELVNSGQANPSQVKQYTDKARSTLRGFGYQGPVVAVDTFIAIINNPDLCDASDYVAANAHAYFDGNVAAEDAGKWAKEQIGRLEDTCKGKKVLITESGWPSKGETNGKAIPSPQNLKAAVDSLQNTIGEQVCLFTAFNDMWKSPGFKNVEQYWGILSV